MLRIVESLAQQKIKEYDHGKVLWHLRLSYTSFTLLAFTFPLHCNHVECTLYNNIFEIFWWNVCRTFMLLSPWLKLAGIHFTMPSSGYCQCKCLKCVRKPSGYDYQTKNTIRMHKKAIWSLWISVSRYVQYSGALLTLLGLLRDLYQVQRKFNHSLLTLKSMSSQPLALAAHSINLQFSMFWRFTNHKYQLKSKSGMAFTMSMAISLWMIGGLSLSMRNLMAVKAVKTVWELKLPLAI